MEFIEKKLAVEGKCQNNIFNLKGDKNEKKYFYNGNICVINYFDIYYFYF